MKKLIAAVIASTAVFSVFTACGKKAKNDDSSKPPALAGSTEATEEEKSQPDPLASTEAIAVTEETSKTEAASETEKPAETVAASQVDPLGGGAFECNPDGAVVFQGDPDNVPDRLLISAAQALFESACRTEWRYTVECPYNVDKDSYIENSLGWRFYRITDSSVSSFNDVKNDYCKVFSGRYPNQLDDYYKEQDGAVYALNGARGSDLYYSVSKITAIESKSDDEIFFTVEHYYDGTDYDGSKPYTETETFSAVIDDDGVWKAGKFRLPY